jgi:hypothetical protein
MKKIVLSTLALALSLGVASAQNDLSVNMTSPAAGSTIGPGLAFDFDISITNLGTQAITATDSVIYFPLLNGSPLVTVQNGQQVTIAFAISGTTMNTNDVEMRSISFAGLNITNGPAGPVDFCGGVIGIGSNWNGVTESDTTNNISCQSVSYDPNGGAIGLAENVLFLEGAATVLDGSYSDGETFFVNVYNMTSASAQVRFIDLTGRTLYSESFNTSTTEIRSEINLSELPEGVLLAVLEVDGQTVNTKKILVK